MSRLDTLIRLNRWQLNERRRRVVELESMAEATRARIDGLDAAFAAEGRRAQASLADRAAFPPYAAAARAQRTKLVETLEKVEAEIAEAREAVTEAFQELKKYEIANEARLDREREFRARRERIAMDEMALEGHRRGGVAG